jgi:hypothetical protein
VGQLPAIPPQAALLVVSPDFQTVLQVWGNNASFLMNPGVL